ncbi:MAG: citramalate synthase [Magnetococcales bacterium]|nr:citramalate synthase [Magnetococcales bacterium]
MQRDRDEYVELYDTTLRDGAQSEGVHFSVEDKLRIARRLDEMGIDFIEGGWPGANPTDVAFFRRVPELGLSKGVLAAFGATCRPHLRADQDSLLKALLDADTPVLTVFGKSWDLHVHMALGISLEENLDLIYNTMVFLKPRVDRVFFDAEHFFDGYKASADYAMKCVNAAREGGADRVVLCDTNGGSLVEEVERITRKVAELGLPVGIHCHNDAELAVANSLAAVRSGAVQVQGTINGLGERCGNANLISLIPNLSIKMGRRLGVDEVRLKGLVSLSRFVNEMANRPTQRNQAYVGQSAFAHKGGIHVSAIQKESRTYEHIDPHRVGNEQRILISNQSGRSNLLAKLKDVGIHDVESGDPKLSALLNEIKELEHQGYQFEGADASFELRARKAFGLLPDYFTPLGFRVIDERRQLDSGSRHYTSEGLVKIEVAGQVVQQFAEGHGPVDALNHALQQALFPYYGQPVKELELTDYKVRILDKGGTDAIVRVLVEWADGEYHFGTVGVSDHIIAASYDAIADGMTYKLVRDRVVPVSATHEQG